MKYILGTAQFGLDYGVSNSGGEISDDELSRILDYARKYGVQYLDTANVYGDSEIRIGEMCELTKAFGLITKITHTKPENCVKGNIRLINSELKKSLKKMKRSAVDVLLIHNLKDIAGQDGEEIYRALQGIKDSGLAKKIGVSVYTVEEAEQVCAKYPIGVLQFPLNVFDQTFDKSGLLKILKKQGVELHARSVFLQGLLLMQDIDINSYFDPIKPLIAKYTEFLKNAGLSQVEGALNYVKQVEEVDAVIFGVQDRRQLADTLDSLRAPSISIDYENFAVCDCNMINPSMWRI